MNRIHFNWITMQNFFSIGAEVKIDFNKYDGMNYIYGINKDLNTKNGSGKSVLCCDSILFALFNKTAKNVSKNNILHRLVKKECKVVLHFNVGEDVYVVENAIHPTYLKLYQNDVDITKSSIKETSDFIETEILKTSYMVFRNSLVLSVQGSRNIFEMPKWEKRNFIEKMLNFSQIGKLYVMTKEDLNALDKELTIKRQEMMLLDRDITQFNEKAIHFNEEKVQTLQRITTKIQELNDEKLLIRIDSTLQQEQRDRIKSAIDKTNATIKDLRDKKDEFNELIVNLKAEINSFNSVKSKYASVLDVIGTCCKTKVETQLGLDKFETSINEKKERIETTKHSYDEINEQIKSAESTKNLLRDKLQIAEQVILKLENNKLLLERIDHDIDEQNIRLMHETIKESPFAGLIEKYTVDLKSVTSAIESMVERRKYLDFMVYIFSEDGVKKHLILDFINILNARIRKYLEEMGCEYTAIFDGNFDCEFITVSGPCEYANFSAGERVRIDSSCLFAFRDLLFGQGTLQSNILICDEILDSGLDEYAINSVIKILKEIAVDQNIFVISHRECISPEDFNRVITVQKQNGFTTIIENAEED